MFRKKESYSSRPKGRRITCRPNGQCVYALFLKHGTVHLISTGSINGMAFKVNNIFKAREIVKSVFKTERLSGCL